MADTVHFELVSPDRLLMDLEVVSVMVPGAEGDFTVLPGHAPLMSSIRPGVVEVMESEGSEVVRMFVRGGFAEVTATALIILAEEAMPVADLSREDLQRRIANAREDLEDAETDEARRNAAETLARLEDMLSVKS